MQCCHPAVAQDFLTPANWTVDCDEQRELTKRSLPKLLVFVVVVVIEICPGMTTCACGHAGISESSARVGFGTGWRKRFELPNYSAAQVCSERSARDFAVDRTSRNGFIDVSLDVTFNSFVLLGG